MKAIALLTTLALTLALASCMTTLPMDEGPKADIPVPAETLSTETESGNGSESGLEQPTVDVEQAEVPDGKYVGDGTEVNSADAEDATKDVPNDPVASDGSNGVGESEEPAPLEDTKDTSVREEIESKPAIVPGAKGLSGGTAFVCDGRSLEAMVLDTDGRTYLEALTIAQNFAILTKTTAYFRWRLPTIQELLCIYEQLFETSLMDIDETYYWASSAEDEDTAPVLYFGTGFESEFYKDMDFVGSIIVREL